MNNGNKKVTSTQQQHQKFVKRIATVFHFFILVYKFEKNKWLLLQKCCCNNIFAIY